MKFARATLLLPATTVAAQQLSAVVARQTDVETITDQYLFDISLDQFETYRNAEDPDTVDWTSDGCTDSPDNPLGFNYVSIELLLSPMIELSRTNLVPSW